MKTPVFRVEKLTCYVSDKREHEEFTVLKVGCESFFATREEMEELHRQITMALNDRKEVADGEKQ